MKLILAIVNNDDSNRASSALVEEGFFVTRLSTTGGFLMAGNTTFLIGTEDKDVQKAIDTLKKQCITRRQPMDTTASFGRGMQHMAPAQQVTVGGATVFVLDVNHMEKF